MTTPSLFNIHYPNCRRGMFSLRQPFKDLPAEPRRVTPAAVELLDSQPPIEPISARPRSKRSAQIQCSLLTPRVHHDIAVQTKNDVYRPKKSRPVKQYEIWDVQSAVLADQTIRYKENSRRRHRRPIIEYPDEEEVESDYDEERIIYARQPRKTIRKTYLPPNVRMICVRDDANRISY